MLVAFHLHCKPVSLNSKKRNLQYTESIQARARSCYAGPLLASPLYSRIIWFHREIDAQGDVDNIAKRIHDALKGVLFIDDRSITHTMTVRVQVSDRTELVADPDDPAHDALLGSLDDESIRDILYIEIGKQTDPKIYLGPIA